MALIPNTFNGQVLKTVFSFAYNFALRSGEYTIPGRKTNSKTLKISNVYIFTSNNRNYIQLSLTFGKTNRFNKNEILTVECTCTLNLKIICPYHNYLYLIKFYQLHNMYSDDAYLFRWKNNHVISHYLISKYLFKLLFLLGIKRSPRIKLHGIRFGRITDLRVSGLPRWLIEKLARHSPNSRMTYYYTRLSSTEEAQFMTSYIKKYFK